MKLACLLCGKMVTRKKLVPIPGLFFGGRIARCCEECFDKPDEEHRKEYEAEYEGGRVEEVGEARPRRDLLQKESPMITCPKCGTTEGITAVSYPGAMDALSYQFNCQCGAMWKRQWGMRIRDSGTKRRPVMAHVEVLPNQMQRCMAAAKEGKCPLCGAVLEVSEEEGPSLGPLRTIDKTTRKTCPECGRYGHTESRPVKKLWEEDDGR